MLTTWGNNLLWNPIRTASRNRVAFFFRRFLDILSRKFSRLKPQFCLKEAPSFYEYLLVDLI